MDVHYDASTARFVTPPTLQLRDKLSEALSYKSPGFDKSPFAQKFIWKNGKRVFNPKYGQWDGYVRLFDRRDNSFPAGLIPRVKRICPFIITSPLTKKLEPVPHGMTGLRWYQEESIEALIKGTRGIAEVPTGGGKTFITGALALAYRNGIGIITVPSKYLLHQTYRELLPIIGESSLGIYGDGLKQIKRVTVATVQSLSASVRSEELGPDVLSWLQAVDWWVCDETHGAAAESYETLGKLLPRAMIRNGVSATPRREDNKELVMEGVMGPLRYKIDPMKLIEEGYLARPNFEWHFWNPGDKIYLPPPGKRKPTYKTIYDECFINDDAYHQKVNELTCRDIADGYNRCVVIVDKLEHGKRLCEHLTHPHMWIDGSAPQKKRDKAIKALVDGDIKVLVGSGILDTGVNIPEIMSLTCAGGGESLVESMQRWGRGLRIDQPARRKSHMGVRINELFMMETKYLQGHAARRRIEAMNRYAGCNTDVY